MDCTETRTYMLGARRRLLPREQSEAIRLHLRECEQCERADAADTELSRALAGLPRRVGSDALRRRLESRWSPHERRWPRRLTQIVATVGLATALAAGASVVIRAHEHSNAMATEAVNDYLRVLYSEHPLEVESGGIHQVKPWFSGRLDFAPSSVFAGDDDFPLKGGSVGYFMDRKAATFIYARGLHVITLFVFRADGLPWPQAGSEPLGGHHAYARESRGFRTLMWRDGDLGYALVSDVSESDLTELARRVKNAGAR
jgi:anti-sigma factor RsiW